MILRRFMKHVSDQNWFAVGLDLLVVITGIFLGMQVTEWNSDRKDRVREKLYLIRLHDDVTSGVLVAQKNLKAREITQQHLSEVLDALKSEERLSHLTDLHCYALFSSHIYSIAVIQLPAAAELTSSGQLSLIQSAELREALSDYSIAKDAMKIQVESITAGRLMLSRKYPDLIVLDSAARHPRETEGFQHQCDFETMKTNIAFTNDLVDNGFRHTVLMEAGAKPIELLGTIHKQVDEALGLEGH